MLKLRIVGRETTALVLGLNLATITPVAPVDASRAAADRTVTSIEQKEPDVSGEAGEFTRGIEALKRYETHSRSAKMAPTAAALKDAQQSAEVAKRELANLQRASGSFSAKLKAAGLWDNFDKDFEARAAKAGLPAAFVDYVRREGGIKVILQNADAASSSQSIDDDLKSIKTTGKVAAVLEMFVGTPVYARCIKCHCFWYAVGAAAALVAGLVPAAGGFAVSGLACVSS